MKVRNIIIMPYSGASDKRIPSNVPKDKRAQWAKVWNKTYSDCISDGSSAKTCETKAFKVANGVVTKTKMLKRVSVTTVDSWSGSASNYKDTDAYCSACLIDVNAAAGKSEKDQAHCKLPVKPPGSSSYADKAVFAAAVRFGSMKKPSDVPAEAWSKAVKSAANKLISAYNTMGKSAPDNIYKAAGKEPPKKERTGMSKGLFGLIDEFVSGMQTVISTFQRRAVSINTIGGAAFDALYQQGAYLTDIYHENGGLVAISSMDGKLYRSTLDINDKGDVLLGDMQEVIVRFDPISRSVIRVTKDGKTQMLAVSSVSVLNKDGEIDSTMLFDSMINYMTETGKSVPRTFLHEGLEFKVGDIVWMGRDDFVLLTLTEYDDSELAKREIEARTKDPEYWGDSIEYNPVGDPEMWEIAEGVTIPVYRAGIPIAVATVPAKFACSYYADKFTLNKQEVDRMALGNVSLDSLRKLFKGDEAKMKEWLEDNVSPINRDIFEAGKIARSEDAPEDNGDEIPEELEITEESEEELEESTDEPEEEAEAEATQEPLVLEFDEQMAQQVAQTVMGSDIFTEFRESIEGFVHTLEDSMSKLTLTVTELQAASVARAKDIDQLKKAESEKQREWKEDLPRNAQRTVSFRPSQHAEIKEPAQRSMQEMAEETLATIK